MNKRIIEDPPKANYIISISKKKEKSTQRIQRIQMSGQQISIHQLVKSQNQEKAKKLRLSQKYMSSLQDSTVNISPIKYRKQQVKQQQLNSPFKRWKTLSSSMSCLLNQNHLMQISPQLILQLLFADNFCSNINYTTSTIIQRFRVQFQNQNRIKVDIKILLSEFKKCLRNNDLDIKMIARENSNKAFVCVASRKNSIFSYFGNWCVP